jgi:hypothetical protein
VIGVVVVIITQRIADWCTWHGEGMHHRWRGSMAVEEEEKNSQHLVVLRKEKNSQHFG